MAALRFKTNLLEHTKAVGRWAQARGGRATVDACTFVLDVSLGERRARLWPQFVGTRGGEQLVYFDQPDRHAVGFVGWSPGPPQAWDLSLSKLAFKQLAQRLGLATPAWWTSPVGVDVPVLVKRARGAFGYGMHGPYPAPVAASLVLAEGEYLEAFHVGRIARAWYWCGRLAVLECFDMPGLAADGQRSWQALLLHAGQAEPGAVADLLALQGQALDAVATAGTRVVADYRYVSPLNPTVYANANVVHRLRGTPCGQQFEAAGRALWPHIPGPEGRQVGFVLDAIVDAQDRVWLLEINSNAQGHPDAVAPMLDGLFGFA